MRLRNNSLFPRLLSILSVLAGSFVLISASGPSFTVHDKAYYASPSLAAFVRPGLVIKITSASIASDGTIKARFKLTDPKGQPLDRDGVVTMGPVSVSFVAAYLPKGQSQYVSYTTRTQTSPINGVSAIQAGADSGGVFEKVGEGEYTYTFRTRAPQGFDTTATHTIGAYGSRNLTEYDMGTNYDDDAFNFVPDGSKVTAVRDVIRTATCNRCHDQMAFHGGSRRSMEVCVLCHTPQTTDPDTGNTVNMPVMTHKIHMGASLPSVKAGTPYVIIGNRQSVNDYSDINFPADPRNCAACHQPDASQAANVFNANRAACGACHDDVNFETGKGHVDLPQVSDSQCTNCHIPKGELEFDASITGAHTIPRFSKTLIGVVLDVLAVDGAAPGKSPTVTFSIKDNSGAPIPISTMARVNLVLAGPNSDYSWYVSEDARKAEGPGDGRYFWTFNAKLPADAKGSYSVGIEARRDATLLPGTTQQMTIREVGKNKVKYFSVDSSPVEPRRTVVSLEKCNACHNSLSLHGDNRNAIEQCVLCHNPNNVDASKPPQSIDFRVMVHRIHTGQELETEYTIGNSKYNEVGYPGDRRNCSGCHVNGSEQLPLAEGRSAVKIPRASDQPVGPETAACTGCHDGSKAAGHAQSNTTQLGESCSVCHGSDSDFSVNRVHAR